MPKLVTQNSKLRAFQYKILKNILYLNKKLFQFGKSGTPLCSFCKKSEETAMQFFSNCEYLTNEWNKVRNYFKNYINLMQLTPQTAILGYTDAEDEKLLLQNHVLLSFKKFISHSRRTVCVILNTFIHRLTKTRDIEKTIAASNNNKLKRYNTKWSCVEGILEF